MPRTPYDQEWLTAKKEFENITKKKKPKDSKGLLNAFGSHTGLSGSLAKSEAAYQLCKRTVFDDVKGGQKAAKAFGSAFKNYQKAKKSYMKVLEKAIYDEFRKTREADFKSTYERALKFLKKELNALESTMDAAVASYVQKFDQASQNLSIQEKSLKNWEKNMKGALMRAAAAAQKVKINPTPDVYNSVFPDAARDITMQLVHARNIDSVKQDPDIFNKRLAPWASRGGGLPATVPGDYTPQQVTKLIKDFTKEIKQVIRLVGM